MPLNKETNNNNKYTVAEHKQSILFRRYLKHSPNDEYENIVIAHIEAAAGYTATQPRDKCRVPWESLVVRKKNEIT